MSLAVAGLALAGSANAQTSRDYISIVGSSTVYPFTTAVAEQFGRGGQFKTPKVESTGTGGGLKLFCNGVGVQHPDIANASRRIKQTEVDTCAKNGVKDIVELKIGYDGIVLAHSKKAPNLKLTRRDVYLALAKQVPDPANPSTLIANPNKTWKQVNSSLPDQKIEVLGPPPTSGTRDSFVELVMDKGAEGIDSLKALKKSDAKAFETVWKSIREDGAYIDAGENDNLIVQKLEANPQAVGIFGYSFLEENQNKIKGAAIDGKTPSYDAIASGDYKVSRPLFVYAKKQHVGTIPGMVEFVKEYVSDKALGEDGYLAAKGLVTLPGDEADKTKAAAETMETIKGDQLM